MEKSPRERELDHRRYELFNIQQFNELLASNFTKQKYKLCVKASVSS